MPGVIQFLEAMGRNPAITQLAPADYAACVATLAVDPDQQEALIARDGSALSRLMDGRAKMFFMIATPEEAPDQDDGYDPDADEPVDPDSAAE